MPWDFFLNGAGTYEIVMQIKLICNNCAENKYCYISLKVLTILLIFFNIIVTSILPLTHSRGGSCGFFKFYEIFRFCQLRRFYQF